jgi:[protein-PII] uridylyltransferase
MLGLVDSALSVRRLRDEVTQHRARLAARILAGDDGIELGIDNARFFDAELAPRFAEASRGASVALAAVGSYGRGAVALRSDADVRILVASSRGRAAGAKIAEAFLYPLWDATLSLGHQVTDIADAVALAPTDLATATSLLDLRLVAGDGAIVSELSARAASGVFAEAELGAFLDRLDAEATARHARFGGSVYLLEPDVKAGAGGLRDLDGARWAAQARLGISSAGGGHAVWTELVRLGVLVPREAKELMGAERFLWRVRNHLHAHAERRSDRLTFEEQETIAVEMGFGDGDRAVAAERFMQEYYLQARVVTRARERLFERARPPKRRGKPVEIDLGRGAQLFDGQVTLASAADLTADPPLALRLYQASLRHLAPVLPRAREAVARAAADPAWCAALRQSPEAAEIFIELVCTVQEAKTPRGSVVGELHDVGLLLAMIPEFSPVTGRVHHDVYHVYTVDVHSVAALDCLRALCRGELASAYPLACRLATLLHDVGKGYPDASGSRVHHSKSGADLCDVILPRLGVSADDVSRVASLVLQHLAMYHTATRRDLDDPATIEDFSRIVRGREGLRDLYLLTVADITTTSPTAMTTWKARMLDELYFRTDAYLAGQVEHGADEERVAAVWEAATALWQGDADALCAFLASMPERYVLANAPESIVAHAAASIARGDAPARVEIVPSSQTDVAELCVIADDRPGLLARIAAAITASRLEVLAAQVHSRPLADGRSEAVDVFFVRDRVDGVGGVERALPRLARDLAELTATDSDPDALLRSRTGAASPWRERPSPAVATEIAIDDRASPRHTVVDVFARDRPGLLYTLAKALHELGLQIALSKINTEGTRVADVFYVTELDGSKVAPGERAQEIRARLARAIDG